MTPVGPAAVVCSFLQWADPAGSTRSDEYMGLDILLLNVLWFPEPTQVPMTHCPNPAHQESGEVAVLCGCPYYCVIRTGLLVIGRGSSWTFWESYFGNLLGIFAIWESHGNLLGIFCEPSLESRGNLAGISWERRYTSVPTRFPPDSHIWDGRGNEGNERVDIS